MVGVLHLAAVVLTAAGASKLRDPDPTRQILLPLGLPSSRAVGRGIGAFEVLVGVCALAWGGFVAVACLSIAYATFAAVALVAWRRGLGSCGCFGVRSGPPGPVHVAVNAGVASTAALAAVLGSTGSLADELRAPGTPAVPYLLAVAIGAFLMIVVNTDLAVVQAARGLLRDGG